MCGLLTIYHKTKCIDLQRSLKALDTMEHRGPDGRGYQTYLDGRLFMGHRRLSIIDKSENAAQPYVSSNNCLVFNGEIYNYLELNKHFRSLQTEVSGDTEVLSELIILRGERIFNDLNGMWGLVNYNQEANNLLISRDRFGKKPLYYYNDDDVFIISSEIKPIIQSGYYTSVENPEAINEYFKSGQVDGLKETFFKGIFRFPSSSFAYYDLNLGELHTPTKYYEINVEKYNRNPTHKVSTLQAEFKSLLSDAITLRMRSDVPLGVCLSGGLDSSSIYGLMHEKMTNDLHSFSAVFPDPECDESEFIDCVVEKYPGVNHKVTPTTENFGNEFTKIMRSLEEPSKAPGVFPQWYVFKLASDHVTVILDGQGGDEILAGYDQYSGFYLADLLTKNPLSLLLSIRSILKEKGSKYTAHAIKGMIAVVLKNKPKFKRSYLKDKLKADIECDILPALLRYEDKLGMAHSLEARMPFLDYRVVDFVFSLDYRLLIQAGILKFFLRSAMGQVLPSLVRNRTDKKGFPTPVKRILEENPALGQYIDAQNQNDATLWRKLSVAIWRNEFMDEC